MMVVEVFAQPGVGSSDALLDLLEYLEVPAVQRDVRRDEEALAEALALGGGVLPVLRRGNQVIAGLDLAAVRQLLSSGAEVGAGLQVELGPEGRPVVIGVEPGSPAENAGLRPGDVIAGLGGYTNFGLSELERVLRQARRGVRLTVQRDDVLVQAQLAS
jgi:predicted metalloprotease with PDZ domain